MHHSANKCRFFSLVAVVSTWAAAATDWPQWRGPERNGVSTETGLLAEWPEGGPVLAWKRADLDSGYAAPAVVGEKIFVLSNAGMENEFLDARSARDGARLWQLKLGNVGNPKQNPSYPAARSTPTVDGGFVYALGSDGDLVCANAATGAEKWRKNLRNDFGGKPGTWAYSESPLIVGNHLICTPGGPAATIVALQKETGEPVWKFALPESQAAVYTSPVVTTVNGAPQVIQVVDKAVLGLDARTGTELWRYDRTLSSFGATIPSPLVYGDLVFSAGNGKGGSAIQIKPAAEGKFTTSELFFSAKFPTGIGGFIRVGGCVYGTGQKSLQCADYQTGTVKWEERSIGPASICCADGRLYLHGENGEVALVEATAAGYHEKGRFSPPDRPKRLNQMEKSWTYPVVANGKLYLRDHQVLWCYDIARK